MHCLMTIHLRKQHTRRRSSSVIYIISIGKFSTCEVKSLMKIWYRCLSPGLQYLYCNRVITNTLCIVSVNLTLHFCIYLQSIDAHNTHSKILWHVDTPRNVFGGKIMALWHFPCRRYICWKEGNYHNTIIIEMTQGGVCRMWQSQHLIQKPVNHPNFTGQTSFQITKYTAEICVYKYQMVTKYEYLSNFTISLKNI